MEKNLVQSLAFQIIGESGDALDAFYQGIKVYSAGDEAAAQKLYAEGQKHLSYVHNIQTDLITAEVNEEEIPYSLLMVHAQDHLSSAINWGRMCRLLMENEEEK